MTKVSIITVNYNGARDTIALLNSLKSINFCYEYEVFVVDNGSKGDDALLIAQSHPWVRVVKSKENLGFAGGNNLAMKYVKGDFVLFLNNDTIAEGDFIAPLVDFMQENSHCGVASPKILYQDDRLIHYAGFADSSSSLRRIVPLNYKQFQDKSVEAFTTPFAHGAAMMVRRDVFESVGTMREDYFLYNEEMEFSIRAKKAGFSIWYLPQSVVLHKGSATIGGLNPISAYYSARNYLYLIGDHTYGMRRIVLLCDKLLAANAKTIYRYLCKKEYSLIKAHLRGVFDFIKGRRGKLRKK